MAFRLLCYLVAIWKGYRAQHPRAKKLPPILPIRVANQRTLDAYLQQRRGSARD